MGASLAFVLDSIPERKTRFGKGEYRLTHLFARARRKFASDFTSKIRVRWRRGFLSFPRLGRDEAERCQSRPRRLRTFAKAHRLGPATLPPHFGYPGNPETRVTR